MTKNVKVRNVTLDDTKCILEIYTYYVKHTAVTFEYDIPTLSEFERRITITAKRYPYLVVEQDGIVQGFAYAGPFIGRAAYDWSCEVTIYISRSAQKCGLGRMLYERLERKLREMGILNLYACIADPKAEDEYLTKNSAQFHAHLGFSKIGEFQNCGYKFGRWYPIIWMEKIIGIHTEQQAPVKFLDK